MLAIIVLFVLLGIEVGFMVYCLLTGLCKEDLRNVVRVGELVLFILLEMVGVIRPGFQWNMLFVVLLLRASMAAWYFLRKKIKKEKIFTKKHVIMSMIRVSLLFVFAVFPAMLFPQFRPVAPTGSYEVKTVSYTLTDADRLETFSEGEENRSVTIQFWYPEMTDDKLPLVVFSHGAFGFRGSNLSTFEDLASNGYVVCSIDHSYHSFFTSQTDGSVIIANMEFINNAMGAQNDVFDEETTFHMTQEWLELRMGDMNFVLDTILDKVKDSGSDEVYRLIDSEKIGLFGHSLGGATAAQAGRQRADIDAVIVLDGTMLGEETGFEDGKVVLNEEPYPIPLLNIYNESHYNSEQLNPEGYANRLASENGVDSKQVVVMGSGHINFTDLPMFSPILANMLDTGKIDGRYCIETMNQMVLDYFDYYLKASGELDLQRIVEASK